MKSSRTLAALVLILLAVAAVVVRWEEWDYQDTAGRTVFQYRGLLLPGQEAQAPPAGVAVATVSVHKRTMLGLNRFDYVGAPGAVNGGYAARSAGW